MSLFAIFKIKKETVSFVGDLTALRSLLETETVFDESQPRGWRYRNAGKRFIGFFHEQIFFLIQKPMSGTRFGAVVQGKFATDGKESTIQLSSWVDPRANRKIIFGCFLSVFITARMIRDHFFADGVVPQDSILPYFLSAVVPMTLLGAYLYERNRNEAFAHVKALVTGTAQSL